MLEPLKKDDRAEDAELTNLPPDAEATADSAAPAPEPEGEPRSVGALLARTRRSFGQGLPEVSQALRIRESYLLALEEDRHADLPGQTYALGFVRSYADYLGLDGKGLVPRYKDEAQGIERKQPLVFLAPMPEAKVPTGAIILVSILLLAFAYAGWSYFSDQSAPAPSLIAASPLPTATEPASPEPVSPGPAGGASAAPTTPASAPAAEQPPVAATGGEGAPANPLPGDSLGGPLAAPLPGSGETPAAATPPEAAEGEGAGGTLPAAPETQTAAAPAAPVEGGPRVVLVAKQDSWVQIRDAKEQAILTRVLREGETYEVPDKKGLVLLTGNAGGLVIMLDGKPLPSLGAVGAVKRNIQLDPEALAAAN